MSRSRAARRSRSRSRPSATGRPPGAGAHRTQQQEIHNDQATAGHRGVDAREPASRHVLRTAPVKPARNRVANASPADWRRPVLGTTYARRRGVRGPRQRGELGRPAGGVRARRGGEVPVPADQAGRPRLVSRCRSRSGRTGCARRPTAATRTADATSGMVAYLDGEPVGWVAVEPRAGYRRLRGSSVPWAGRTEDPDDPDVWAIVCFAIRPGFRGQGLTRPLARRPSSTRGRTVRRPSRGTRWSRSPGRPCPGAR